MSIDATNQFNAIRVDVIEEDISIKVSAGLRGPVGFEYLGEYSAGTTYYSTNAVKYSNALYIGNTNITGSGITGVLPTDTNYWNLLLSSTGPFSAIASQAQAEAGTDNTTGMTPLRTLQTIQEHALVLALTTKNTDYTILSTDSTIICNASTVNLTMTLPAAGTVTNQIYNIKKADATVYTIIVDGNGSETIDGASTFTLTSQWECITVQSDGSNWFIL